MNGFQGYERLARVYVSQVLGHCPCGAEMLFGYDEVEHLDGLLPTVRLKDAWRACDECGEVIDCSHVVITIDEGKP